MPPETRSGPHRAGDATGAEVEAGQADHHQGTRPPRREHVAAALLSARARGCTCSPVITDVPHGRLTYLQVCHDADCPVVAEVSA